MDVYFNGVHLEDCEIEVKGVKPIRETDNRERRLGPCEATVELNNVSYAPGFLLYLYYCYLVDRLNKAREAAKAEGKLLTDRNTEN